MTKTSLHITLRPEEKGDLHYILSSWKRSFFETLPWLNSETYYPMISTRINALRYSPKTHITVACSDEDPDFIFGWTCRSDTHVHYTFVRQAFRGAMVATRLLAPLTSEPIKATHWTRACEGYSLRHPGSLIYVPSDLPRPPDPV